MVDTEPYGADADYADPGYQEDKVKRYPLDTKEHARAALSYFSMEKNAAKYSPDERSKIMARIHAACKKFGIELSDESSKEDDGKRSALVGDIELRTTFFRVELRGDVAEDGRQRRELGGYAAVFNRDSRNFGTFVERVVPSFFDEEKRNGWPGLGAGVVCRYNHKDDYLLGSTRSGTLKLSIDRVGLDYAVQVPETRSDVYELGERGDLGGSSFAFAIGPEGCDWSYNDAGVTQRTLLQGQLIDVAPCSAPIAYPDATVALRSLAAFKHVPAEDVFELAREHELRRLFIRIDQSPMPVSEPVLAPVSEPSVPATLSWQEAKLHVLRRRPTDPIK